MERLLKKIVSQVWDFVHNIEYGKIESSVIEGHKIPSLAVDVLQDEKHPSHRYISNLVFRHVMENVGYYDLLPEPDQLRHLTEDTVNEKLYHPDTNNTRQMLMPKILINDLRNCILWIEELATASECQIDAMFDSSELQFSKGDRQYVVDLHPDYRVLYGNSIAVELIGSTFCVAGKDYRILPDGCNVKTWRRNVTTPDDIQFGLSSFASKNTDTNKASYYRYITVIGKSESPFSMMHRYHFLSENVEVEGIEFNFCDELMMRSYVCHSKEHQFLVIDTMEPLTAKEMIERSFCYLVALGLITSTVYLDECWLFAYDDIEHSSCEGMVYQSLSPSRHCKYPIFTTNVFQYLVPVGRNIAGKNGENRAIQLIQYFNLSQALPLFPMDVFSRLVEVMAKYECVCRGTFMILSGTDYPLEVQPGVFAVALEAISNVKNKLMGDDSKFIVSQDLFDELQIKENVSGVLNTALEVGKINEAEYGGLAKRIDQLNEAFNSDKLKFMLERFNYPFTKDDTTTLKLRNTLLHGSININNKNFRKYGESGSLFKVALIFHKLSLSVPLLMAGYHSYIINNAKAYGFENSCKSFIKIGHWDNKMLDNQTGRSFIDTFDEYYSDAFFGICNLLEKFKIKVVDAVNFTVPETFKDDPDAEGMEPLRNFIQKTEYDASSTDATIVVDFALCDKIGIKGNMLLASIAHEVGHVIFFFLSNNETYDNEAEEMKADTYAKKVHLDIPLIESLKLLINSGYYPVELCDQMMRRIERLKSKGLFE